MSEVYDNRVDPYDMDAALDAHIVEAGNRRLAHLIGGLNRTRNPRVVNVEALALAVRCAASVLTRQATIRWHVQANPRPVLVRVPKPPRAAAPITVNPPGFRQPCRRRGSRVETLEHGLGVLVYFADDTAMVRFDDGVLRVVATCRLAWP